MRLRCQRPFRRWSKTMFIFIFVTTQILIISILGLRRFFHIPTINLVVATLKEDNPVVYQWTGQLPLQNLQVIRYVANDPSARFHPTVARGNEAMIYLTYMHEFYNRLPDISIFVHAGDFAWHNDEILLGKVSYALRRLDIDEVFRRQYVNLRLRWTNGCPAWINTTVERYSSQFDENKPEEPVMNSAFRALFPGDTVPEVLGGTCCSQFAVTKKAIRTIPRHQYKEHIDWFEKADLPDSISGRLWEHLWPYLFLKQAVECLVEYKALCRQYHICFESQEDLDAWYEAQKFLKELSYSHVSDEPPEETPWDRTLNDILQTSYKWKKEAMERGELKWMRQIIAGDS